MVQNMLPRSLHVVMILDNSGSMRQHCQALRRATANALNVLANSQQGEIQVTVDIVLLGSIQPVQHMYMNQPVANAVGRDTGITCSSGTVYETAIKSATDSLRKLSDAQPG